MAHVSECVTRKYRVLRDMEGGQSGLSTYLENKFLSCMPTYRCKLIAAKEDGLAREFSCNSKPTFYPCTVFRQPRPLPESALSCRWLADDCIVFYGTRGVPGENSIVYNF